MLFLNIVGFQNFLYFRYTDKGLETTPFPDIHKFIKSKQIQIKPDKR